MQKMSESITLAAYSDIFQALVDLQPNQKLALLNGDHLQGQIYQDRSRLSVSSSSFINIPSAVVVSLNHSQEPAEFVAIINVSDGGLNYLTFDHAILTTYAQQGE